ncbi:MAG: glycoside hydrolase family 1 protein, partial [Chloroflexi bacterium]|nr:glycoside hydrolase family 1 protein [Chloroflexota bacterium]
AWEQLPGKIRDGSASLGASNWWQAGEKDLRWAAELGQNTHRLSVEWSRIEPRPGEWDDAALNRYRELLGNMRSMGMTPMITLHHFSNPIWLEYQGGWEHRDVIRTFVRYIRHVVEHLGDLCNLWCVINEPNVYAYYGYTLGIWPPGKQNLVRMYHVLNHMIRAYRAAYNAIHQLQSETMVGIAHHVRAFDPVNPTSPFDRSITRLIQHLFNRAVFDSMLDGKLRFPVGVGYIPGSQQAMDFIGLNYYAREFVSFDPTQPARMFSRSHLYSDTELGPEQWGEIYPHGLYRFIKDFARLGKPIFITENGRPDSSDEHRSRFLLTHLAAIWRAIQDGADVRGYYHWTLVDNFEWAEGWGLRFGLIALDLETGARTLRRSGELYAAICKAGGISREIVQCYAPEAMQAVFGPSLLRKSGK